MAILSIKMYFMGWWWNIQKTLGEGLFLSKMKENDMRIFFQQMKQIEEENFCEKYCFENFLDLFSQKTFCWNFFPWWKLINFFFRWNLRKFFIQDSIIDFFFQKGQGSRTIWPLKKCPKIPFTSQKQKIVLKTFSFSSKSDSEFLAVVFLKLA